LHGIGLSGERPDGLELHRTNLTGASLSYNTTLTNANQPGANLSNADFSSTTLTNANLTGPTSPVQPLFRHG